MRNMILPTNEIQRNKRINELMKNKQPKISNVSKPLKLTQSQFDKVKELQQSGISRDEAVKIVLNEK